MSGKGAMTIKKYIGVLSCFLLLSILIMPGSVLAADIVWQLQWQDNGTLQEEVQIQGRQITDVDPSWKVRQEGEILILSREVADWSSYQTLPDSLPLEVKQRNYLVGRLLDINIAPPPSGNLWEQLQGLAGFHFNLSVPGYIKAAATQQWTESQATWELPDARIWMQPGSLARVITVDGFLLAVVIILLAVLGIGLAFRRQMKKADQIIYEEYIAPPETTPPDQTEP